MIKEIKGEDFRKMQLTELDMLVEFDKVCRKYNINYVLFGGSLLGAVRHQGGIFHGMMMLTLECFTKITKHSRSIKTR